jgi:hypothetical protein
VSPVRFRPSPLAEKSARFARMMIFRRRVAIPATAADGG